MEKADMLWISSTATQQTQICRKVSQAQEPKRDKSEIGYVIKHGKRAP